MIFLPAKPCGSNNARKEIIRGKIIKKIKAFIAVTSPVTVFRAKQKLIDTDLPPTNHPNLWERRLAAICTLNRD